MNTKPLPPETSEAGRATLADIWPLLSTPLMKAVASHEEPLPALERVDVSIRPLRADLWPPCPVCKRTVDQCECGA